MDSVDSFQILILDAVKKIKVSILKKKKMETMFSFSFLPYITPDETFKNWVHFEKRLSTSPQNMISV